MMNRRSFVKQSCFACLGAGLGMLVLDSCKTIHYTNGTINGNKITAPLSEFTQTNKQGKETFRSYILVRHDSLQYPICVYRFSNNEYKALWLSCTHQGAELQVLGDTLVCQAHGSEFDNKGKVTSGPADKDLRSFEVYTDNQLLTIVLK